MEVVGPEPGAPIPGEGRDPGPFFEPTGDAGTVLGLVKVSAARRARRDPHRRKGAIGSRAVHSIVTLYAN